jgi:hypothetical protein
MSRASFVGSVSLCRTEFTIGDVDNGKIRIILLVILRRKGTLMAEQQKKHTAAAKTPKTKAHKAALMMNGTEALVPSKAPGPLATVKRSPRATKKATTFTLTAPHATRVFIAGSFNAWAPDATPLEQDKTGLWRRTVRLDPGRYEYRFVVDDVWWDDPTNTLRSSNEFGTQNAVIIVE